MTSRLVVEFIGHNDDEMHKLAMQVSGQLRYNSGLISRLIVFPGVKVSFGLINRSHILVSSSCPGGVYYANEMADLIDKKMRLGDTRDILVVPLLHPTPTSERAKDATIYKTYVPTVGEMAKTVEGSIKMMKNIEPLLQYIGSTEFWHRFAIIGQPPMEEYFATREKGLLSLDPRTLNMTLGYSELIYAEGISKIPQELLF